MKKSFCILGLLLVSLLANAASVKSPNGNIELKFSVDENVGPFTRCRTKDALSCFHRTLAWNWLGTNMPRWACRSAT